MAIVRPDLAARIIDDYLAANPQGQRTDIVVSVTDTIVSESSRIITRPAMAEEMAKIEVARRIDVAAKVACFGASRKEVG